jgi:pilus assembly protein CpaF
MHAARSSGGLLEARVENGLILTAALPPLAARGAAMTLRRAGRTVARLADLVGEGVLTQNMADFLELAVKARRNVIVSGTVGSGRSTMLNALGRALVADGERVVSIEETEELDFGEGAHVALVGRGPHARHAMQAAMRLRPDRLVVGDLRGAEALDMVTAMVGGADGGLCGVQAASTRDALQRVVQLARLAPEAPSAEVLREETGRGAHLVVHMTRTNDGEPRVGEVAEVSNGELTAVFTFKPDAAGGRFSPTGHVPGWAEGAPPSMFRA